jgi:hypothetical protein
MLDNKNTNARPLESINKSDNNHAIEFENEKKESIDRENFIYDEIDNRDGEHNPHKQLI